jgi:hypothetical protein
MSSASERLSAIASQVSGGGDSIAKRRILEKKPDDVVITFAARTPLTKAKKGGLKDTQLDELLISLLTVSWHNSKCRQSTNK